ncbi:MAG: hypothetical protein ACRDQ5_02610 [Sciscionella sp.]
MTEARFAQLAAGSPNFGQLIEHEPVLVSYGVAAETSIYADPNTSLIKSRQFAEALTDALLARLGIGGRSGARERQPWASPRAARSATANTWPSGNSSPPSPARTVTGRLSRVVHDVPEQPPSYGQHGPGLRPLRDHPAELTIDGRACSIDDIQCGHFPASEGG